MAKTSLWITGAMIVAVGTAGIASAHGKGYGDRSARGPMFEEMFGEMDADGDGRITAEEIEVHRAARFAAVDANGDGKLSVDEMMAARDARRSARMADRIARLDADGDGLLSAEEMEAAGPRRDPAAMLERFDADGDGAVTLEEMQQARKGPGFHGGEGRSREHGHHGGMGHRFFGMHDESDDG